LEIINLLKETLEILKEHGKSPNDVLWVGSKDGEYAISWKEFEKIAKKVNYNCDFGSQKIACDLVVVGKNWWLERSEYDGAEGWVFKTKPKRKRNAKKFNIVCVDDVGLIGWEDLNTLNGGDKNES